MFILYAVALGILLGFVLGGRPAGLADLHLRYGWVMIAGLACQVVLFSAPVTARIGDLGPLVYVASTSVVIAAILANRAVPGMLLVAAGALSNLVAIVANGGYMPAGAGAMASLGRTAPTDYSNSAILADPLLAPLTDIFAMPAWVPLANVFSIGDVLIGAGVVVAIVVAMRSSRAAAASEPAAGSEPAAAA
jgi:Family of unknown function (DUF5317)